MHHASQEGRRIIHEKEIGTLRHKLSVLCRLWISSRRLKLSYTCIVAEVLSVIVIVICVKGIVAGTELLWTDVYKVVILITKSLHLQHFLCISRVLPIDKSERVNSAVCA
jgi:hypothetical protein